jgi:tetratricopeptide (TPR) repeat protein
MRCKANFFFLILFIFLNFCSNNASSGDIKKAKEFMKALMFNQAIIELKNSINNKPTNPEAHFLLGKCYLFTSQINDAKTSFERAITLDSNYGYKTADAFFEAAVYLFGKGGRREVNELFLLAGEEMPSIKDKISDFYFEQGNKASSHEEAANLYILANKFSNKHNIEISNYFYNNGNKSLSLNDIDTAWFFFRRCIEINPEQTKLIVEQLLENAQRIIIDQPDISAAILNLALSFDNLVFSRIIKLINENKIHIESKGHNVMIKFLYDAGMRSKQDRKSLSQIIFNIAKREKASGNLKLFSDYYSKAISLNTDIIEVTGREVEGKVVFVPEPGWYEVIYIGGKIYDNPEEAARDAAWDIWGTGYDPAWKKYFKYSHIPGVNAMEALLIVDGEIGSGSEKVYQFPDNKNSVKIWINKYVRIFRHEPFRPDINGNIYWGFENNSGRWNFEIWYFGKKAQ